MKDPRKPWPVMLLALLLLLSLSGCASYYDAVVASNKSRDEHPRMAKITLTPQDATKPAVFSNVVMSAEIPLDSWQRSIEPVDPGAMAKKVADGLAPVAIAYEVADGVKAAVAQGGSRSTSTTVSTTGAGAGVNSAGGNVGSPVTTMPTTTTTTTDNHSGAPAGGQ